MPYKDKDKQKAYRKKHREANIDHYRDYEKKRNRTLNGRAYNLIKGCKNRCKKKNLEFDLNAEWLRDKVLQGCVITGHEFSYNNAIRRMDIFAPSMDRIDPNKGYTKDNVQVVCFGVNALKGGNTMSDMYRLAEMIVNNKIKPSIKRAI